MAGHQQFKIRTQRLNSVNQKQAVHRQAQVRFFRPPSQGSLDPVFVQVTYCFKDKSFLEGKIKLSVIPNVRARRNDKQEVL